MKLHLNSKCSQGEGGEGGANIPLYNMMLFLLWFALDKPVSAREREARYNEDTLFVAAEHLI